MIICVWLNDIPNLNFQANFRLPKWVDMKWSEVIRTDIIMGSPAPCAQIIPDKVKIISDMVKKSFIAVLSMFGH